MPLVHMVYDKSSCHLTRYMIKLSHIASTYLGGQILHFIFRAYVAKGLASSNLKNNSQMGLWSWCKWVNSSNSYFWGEVYAFKCSRNVLALFKAWEFGIRLNSRLFVHFLNYMAKLKFSYKEQIIQYMKQ